MRFVETAIDGVLVVEVEPRADERGSFGRLFCTDELAAHGIDFSIAQMNVSANHQAGTVRGLHYQRPPDGEIKLFRCTRGRTFHVGVDVREGSPTYLQWVGVELAAGSGRSVLFPELFATGYQALTPDAEVTYAVTAPYAPESEAGLRFDDPALAIEWPIEPNAVSDKDRCWPLVGRPQETPA